MNINADLITEVNEPAPLTSGYTTCLFSWPCPACGCTTKAFAKEVPTPTKELISKDGRCYRCREAVQS